MDWRGIVTLSLKNRSSCIWDFSIYTICQLNISNYTFTAWSAIQLDMDPLLYTMAFEIINLKSRTKFHGSLKYSSGMFWEQHDQNWMEPEMKTTDQYFEAYASWYSNPWVVWSPDGNRDTDLSQDSRDGGKTWPLSLMIFQLWMFPASLSLNSASTSHDPIGKYTWALDSPFLETSEQLMVVYPGMRMLCLKYWWLMAEKDPVRELKCPMILRLVRLTSAHLEISCRDPFRNALTDHFMSS